MTDDLADTLREIVTRLDAQGIPYMLVGSVAALAHGHVRSTQDFDLVIEVDAARLNVFVRSLPQERFYASEEAATEALRYATQFNVIDLATGWKVDLIPRKDRPFSASEFGRRIPVEVFGLDIAVATIEDTILAKLEWATLSGGSERQIEDVRALVGLAGEALDRAYVERWVGELELREAWQRALQA
jgi:hypothetical protein